MNFFLKAITDATHDSTKIMTAEVRQHALNQGWEPEVAAGLTISFNGDNIKYDLGDKHRDRAFVHEFGDENKQPKATVRRYLNDKGTAKQTFQQVLSAHLGAK